MDPELYENNIHIVEESLGLSRTIGARRQVRPGHACVFRLSLYILYLCLLLTETTNGNKEFCPPDWPEKSTLTDDGVCYFLHKSLAKWDPARDACELSGGRLVQALDEGMFLGISNDVFRTVFAEMGFDCVWIGLSDKEIEGSYTWVHESSVGIRVVDHFGWNRDCAAYCVASFTLFGLWPYKVYIKHCESTLPILCQYVPPQQEASGETVSTGQIPPTKPSVTNNYEYNPVNMPVKSYDNKYKLRSERIKVFSIVHPEQYIVGKAMWTRKSYMMTMCARLCMAANSGCHYVNYSAITHECRGFSDIQTVTMEYSKHWNVWRYVEQPDTDV